MSEKSSFQALALDLRSLLCKATGLKESQVIIGSPHEAAKQQEKVPDEDYLSIFFYRIGYSGFPTDAAPADPLYLQAFCLVSALGGRPSSGTPTPGESELKLMGAVAGCFHKTPFLKLNNNGGIKPHVQIIPSQLTLEDINRLWSTQNNIPYRLSLAYEFALLPVPLAARVERSPRVGAVSLDEQLMTSEFVVDTEKRFFSAQVPIVKVDIQRPDWAPHIYLLDDTGNPSYTRMQKSRPTEISLVVLGDPTEKNPLSLEWEVWDPNSKNWKTGLADGNCGPAAPGFPAAAIQIRLPSALGTRGQALLRVVRHIEPQKTLSSNPVLITVGSSL